MKRHALFVGVDQYADGHIPNLSCAVSDATDLHGFFKYGAGYDRVELLQNPAGKKEVLSKVRELTGDLGCGDFFLLFFAGHGFRVGENHVLVCANDLYEDVKYEDDGLPLGQLKRRLVGAFDSALLLDACQADILATRGGEGIAERDLSLIHEAPVDRTCGGALTIVTSCDAGQTAAELSEARHGLFTLAMLDLLKEAQGAHTRLDLSDSFKMSLGRRMHEIAARSGLSTDQRPRFSCPGETCFILLDGAAPKLSSEIVLPTMATLDSALKPCPVCGRNNSPTNTFNCIVCGTKNLCVSHYSVEYNRCEACAKKKINTKKALSAYNDNNWDLAYELMQNGDDSDPEGQYVLARLYELGCTYIDNDEDKAFELFGKAAEQGYADAQFKLADYYTVGCSVAKSPQEAYKWYMKAARQGHVEAQDFVGWCYETGFGVDEDLESAFVWYSRAAERGRAAAQCSLGRLYANGEGVEADAEESVKWFRKAADQGNAEAMYELGEHYRLGEGVAQSDDEAIKWYHLAADQGSEDAQDRLDELEPQENEDCEENEESEEVQEAEAAAVNIFTVGSRKKTIQYMLTAFRDGFHCVMGARVQSKHFLPAVEAAYDAGVRWFEMGGGASFQTSFFYCQENSFDVMDSFRRICPDAELQTLSRGNNIVGLESQPSDVIKLYANLFKKHGVDAIRNYDALYDPNNLKTSAQCIHDAGMRHEVVVGIMGIPPGLNLGYVHSPEFYAERLRIYLEFGMPIDRVCFKDNSGTTPPSVIYNTICQARRLLGNGVHIQFHTHDSLGLGNESCMAALKGGADGLDLSFAPLSGGSCQPDLISMYQVLRGSDEFEFDFNCEKMNSAVNEFREVVRKYYLPHEALSQNQMLANIPVQNGTLVATLMQLNDNQVEQPYEKLIPEFAECFKRGGCAAASMTPVGQFYIQQATMNILNAPFVRFAPGYAKLLLGYFGKLPVEPDPEVVKAAMLSLSMDPTTKAYACTTTRQVIDLNDADPNKGIASARRKLQENGLPTSDENIFIAATCKDKGIQFLKGKAVLGCRFAN